MELLFDFGYMYIYSNCIYLRAEGMCSVLINAISVIAGVIYKRTVGKTSSKQSKYRNRNYSVYCLLCTKSTEQVNLKLNL